MTMNRFEDICASDQEYFSPTNVGMIDVEDDGVGGEDSDDEERAGGKSISAASASSTPLSTSSPPSGGAGSVGEMDPKRLSNLFDHVFFMGDLNYRVDVAYGSALKRVAAIRQRMEVWSPPNLLDDEFLARVRAI